MIVRCPHAGPCPGCPWIAFPDERRRELAVLRVRSAVERVVELRERGGLEVAACAPSPLQAGWRTQVRLAVSPAPRGRSRIGPAGARRGDVVDIPECKVLARPLARRLDELRGRSTAGLRAVTVRIGDGNDGEAQIVLHTEGGDRVLGAATLAAEAGGERFDLLPGDAFPPNPPVAEREAALAADWLGAAPAGAEIACVDPAPGVHARLVARALGRSVPRSCSPNTARAALIAVDLGALARDLVALRRSGLRTVRLHPVDAEPLSDRVHAVALLERTAAPWAPAALYEDLACLVLDKPGAIASTGPDSLDALLVEACGGTRALWPVHRLDAGTSGAILFARTREATQTLGDALAHADVERHYQVLVRGAPRATKGLIDTPLDEPGKPGKRLDARTRWQRRGEVGPHTLLDVQVETGRTHQIRRHLAGLGHPVVGDARYGDATTNDDARARARLDRPFVHASVLAFASPATGAAVRVEAPLAADLDYTLALLAATGRIQS